MKINHFTDSVVFHDAWFIRLYLYLKGIGTKKNAPATIKSMKARVQIALLEYCNAGYQLVRDVLLPIFEDITHKNNVALIVLRYFFEFSAMLPMLYYDNMFKTGKSNVEAFDVMALLLFDNTVRKRHNSPDLLVESIDQKEYWRETDHPMYKFLEESFYLADEIMIEGGAMIIINEVLNDTWESTQAKSAVTLNKG